MNLRAKIAVAAGVLLLAGCRELPRYFAGDTTIARAGGKDLRLGDVRSVVPQGLSGDDSAGFSPRAEKRAHGPLPPRARR